MLNSLFKSLLLKIIGIAILMIIGILLGNKLGGKAFYEYSLVMRWFALLGIICLFGSDSNIIKVTSQKNNVYKNLNDAILISISFSLITFFFLGIWYYLLNDNYIFYIFLASTLVFPYTIIKIYSSYLNGKNQVLKSIFFSDIFVNLFVLILITSFFDKISSFNEIFFSLLFTRFFVSVFVYFKLKKHLNFNFRGILFIIKKNTKNLYNLLISVFHSFNSNIIVFFGFILVNENELGSLSLAVKLCTIFLIPMQVLNIMNANQIARNYKFYKINKINSILKKSFYLNSTLVLIGIIFFSFLHVEIISLWGNEFILSTKKYFNYIIISYIFFSFGLPCDTIFIMTNNNLYGFIINLFFLIVLLLIFIMYYTLKIDFFYLMYLYSLIVLIFQILKFYIIYKKTKISIL